MVSAVMCLITHWIRHMVSHDIGYRVVMTSPNQNVAQALNLERILS